jgi:hypothetical protein
MPLSPNLIFVGRKADLRMLARALKGGETVIIGPAAIAAATGLGGVGKTQLAAEFAHPYGRCPAGGGQDLWTSGPISPRCRKISK